MRTILWLFVVSFMAGCSRQAPDPGGGEHKITGITIHAREHSTLVKNRNPLVVTVGARVPLRVVASWAIPSVTDVTDQAKLTVIDPAYGEVDNQAVFTARAPGKAVIEAALRVAGGAGGNSVITFTDRMQLRITADNTANP